MSRYPLFCVGLALFLAALCAAAEPSPAMRMPKEIPLAPDLNAYNPIPSPDGKSIAFVAIAWDGSSNGRSSLTTEVMLMNSDGKLLSGQPLARTFLAGWTPDGKHLVCYRDMEAFIVSLDGERSRQVRLPDTDRYYSRPERVAYLGGEDALVWRTPTNKGDLLETPLRLIAANGEAIHHLGHLAEILSVSPDGRYIAIPGVLEKETVLWVCDLKDKSWRNLGPIAIHPDANWDYIKPSWNPWSLDSHLAFASKGEIVLATPDGKSCVTLAKPAAAAGLTACSPSGKCVAYVTFEPEPMKGRPDLRYYGNTTIWVVRTEAGGQPVAVTGKAPQATYDLKWLGDHALVFDRIGTKDFLEDARMWKVDLPAQEWSRSTDRILSG